MKKLIILGIACLGFISINAQEGYHEHDGFYLSMALGGSSGTINAPTSELSGGGGVFDFKIGGTISKNLILHATITSFSISGPTFKSNGVSEKISNSVSVGQAIVGAGLTYYIMPSNIFVSGSVGLGNFSIFESTNSSNSISTDNGTSLQLKVGKEWWVSKNWGLGVSGFYNSTNVDQKSTGLVAGKWSGSQVGIAFNATFN